MSQAHADDFCGGPPSRFAEWFGLIKPGDQRIRLRAIMVVLIAWAPLVVLAALQDLTHGGDSLRSLLVDFGAYARYVVAAPLCVIAEALCYPRIEKIIAHFRNTEIVPAADQERFETLVESSRRMLQSPLVEGVTFVIAYSLVVVVVAYARFYELPTWHLTPEQIPSPFSPAGKWHVMISLPLLIVLLFGWVWRFIVWCRFLWRLTRLDLQVIAGHPDGCCGLKFLSTSIRAYAPLGFVCTSILAGGIANRLTSDATALQRNWHLMVLVVVLVMLLFIAPLVVFAPLLRRAQVQAIFEYGALARSIGGQFERKWIARREPINSKDLDTAEFSATTDLYSIVASVYSVHYLPLSVRTLQELLVITALPFLPVILSAAPLGSIFKRVVKLLI